MGKKVWSGIIEIAICYLSCYGIFALGCLIYGEPLMFSWKGETIILALTVLLYLGKLLWKQREKKRYEAGKH